MSLAKSASGRRVRQKYYTSPLALILKFLLKIRVVPIGLKYDLKQPLQIGVWDNTVGTPGNSK
jgi:hypothetical protein